MDDPAKRATGQLGEYGTMNRTAERPFSEIVGDIVTHAQEIVRSEVRLAKTELKEEGVKAARASVMLAAGAFVGLYALGFILWAAAYALGLIMPQWVGALIVGVVLAIAAGAMVMMGLARFKTVEPVPDKAVGQVKEDVEWLKQQTK